MQKKITPILLLLLISVSCASPALQPTATTVAPSTLTAIPPFTETVPPTERPRSTETLTPESTQAPTLEGKIVPAYTVEVDENINGVQIKASFITDETAVSPTLSKVDLPEKTGAEFVARMFFSAWVASGNLKHVGMATEDDFNEFMTEWGNNEAIITIKTANLGKVNVQLISSGGEALDETAISKTVITYVDTDKFEGLNIVSNPKWGYKTELVNNVLYVYLGGSHLAPNNPVETLLLGYSCVPTVLISGNEPRSIDNLFYKLLKSGGLKAVK